MGGFGVCQHLGRGQQDLKRCDTALGRLYLARKSFISEHRPHGQVFGVGSFSCFFGHI